ncbi:hypothetical protein GWC77_03770 [Paraburkholderia sp. NMBU_R16]|uniref:hypothetical protein n=1 Tax=Paraburkholderia sp. NMBU_R16 TaxID=2698676 RepID=UPI001564822E|nr:hypothetical protein [Paraburkholderia sp. NMBU_R16]NRO95058.1 hypothetical protein [Paraburkholderia sp. NMBU_R16]
MEDRDQTLLLLDLDGTLIDTPHYQAWDYAARQFGVDDLSYAEYVAYIAGRPRLEGASRLIELKRNCRRVDTRRPQDSWVLAESKQAEFLRLSEDTRLFDDALRLLHRLETSQLRVRFYTASENAARLFTTALRRSGKSLCPQQSVVQQQEGQTRGELFLQLAGESAAAAVTLVDDAPHAVDAACAIGLSAYQIRRSPFQPPPTHSGARILPSLDCIPVPINVTVGGLK